MKEQKTILPKLKNKIKKRFEVGSHLKLRPMAFGVVRMNLHSPGCTRGYHINAFQAFSTVPFKKCKSIHQKIFPSSLQKQSTQKPSDFNN